MGKAETVLHRIRGKFSQDAPSLLEALSQAFQDEDWPLLADRAHYLASSAHAVQAPDLAVLAKALENAAKLGGRAEAANALEAFVAKTRQLLATF